jgi:acetyl esterase
MPLDSGYEAVLESIRKNAPLQSLTVAEVRSRIAQTAAMTEAGADVGNVQNQVIEYDGVRLRGRAYFPRADLGGPVIVYFHGGGWVVGSIDTVDAPVRFMCERLGATIISVDYPLAPEYPFPAAVDAAWSALRWAIGFREEHGLTDSPLVVGGDSAGANLAAVTALRARDTSTAMLDAQFLIYPVTDGSMLSLSYKERGHGYLLSAELMAWFWDHYAPRDVRLSPWASPLHAPNLDNLAPAVILTAEYDPLRDEGEQYAERLRRAGVKVAAHRFHDQMHGFVALAPAIPSARQALEHSCDALRRILAA